MCLKSNKKNLKKLIYAGILAMILIGVPVYGQNNDFKNQVKNSTLTFIAVGDIMLSRKVAARIAAANNLLYPFKNMEPLLDSTDFNFGNLEGPMTGQPNVRQGHLVFNAPLKNVAGLIKYHFIVNTANNHVLDQGPQGLIATINNLHYYKIPTIGTGINLSQAWQPTFISVKGETIAFIGASYTAYNQKPRLKSQLVARVQQLNDLVTEINFAKKYADFIVVTMHAGKEYTRNPNQEQIDFAHTAIKAGADIVIGAHPHWIQQIEKFQHKYIFYSLGNFIFDQDWGKATREGLVLKLALKKKPTAEDPNKLSISSIKLIPINIVHSVPKVATPEQSANILEKIGIPPSTSYLFTSH